MSFKAGQWQSHADNWQSIKTSQTVLDWIKEGVKLPFETLPQPFELTNRHFSPKETRFIDQEISVLLQSGAIAQSIHRPFCVSPISCVPKKNAEFRLIINLRRLNYSCPCPAFQYEDINTVLDITNPGDLLVTLDIKSGFHHLPIHPDYQKYLGFCWRNKYYIWCVLPFGLSVSPFYFCKCIRQVIKYLREADIRISVYMDDFILAASEDTIVSRKDFVFNLLQDLGFTINTEKSSLTPSTEKTYIGYIICTSGVDGQIWIKIPQARIHKLRRDILRTLNHGLASARALARIAG